MHMDVSTRSLQWRGVWRSHLITDKQVTWERRYLSSFSYSLHRMTICFRSHLVLPRIVDVVDVIDDENLSTAIFLVKESHIYFFPSQTAHCNSVSCLKWLNVIHLHTSLCAVRALLVNLLRYHLSSLSPCHHCFNFEKLAVAGESMELWVGKLPKYESILSQVVIKEWSVTPCQTSLAYHGSTTTMHEHLKRKHSGVIDDTPTENRTT